MVFDGKEFAKVMKEDLAAKIAESGVSPKLVWMCVGEDEASLMYGRLKAKAAGELGISFEKAVLEVEIEEEILRNKIRQFCSDEKVHGVMVQLPAKIKGNLYRALAEISASKDVDCLNPYSVGLLMAGQPIYLPATVAAIGRIIVYALGQAKVPLSNSELLNVGKILFSKRVAVVGGGWEVGKPLVGLMSNWGASVLWARSSEENLGEILRMADIVVSATGRENLITGLMLNPGAIVIDVGAPRGDIDFPSVSAVAGFVTPVPGGVGPVTVASLMANVVAATER